MLAAPCFASSSPESEGVKTLALSLSLSLSYMERKEVRRLVYLLSLGQLVSLLLAASTFTTSLIANLGIDIPLAQSFCAYLSLSLVYGAIFLSRHQKLQVPWYWYFALAFVDVHGNYLVITALHYSSITSVALLDCWTIPWVIILTWYVFGTKYSPWQFLGAAVCVIGLALVCLSDSRMSNGGGTKPLLGDALVIAGTLCYALSNVGEEIFVKRNDRVEVLAMLGIFGVLITGCETLIFERKDLQSVKWSTTIMSLFVCYGATAFLFYTVVPFVMKMSGSTLFNLSLLTSDIWAVAIRVFFYHEQVNWLYYLAFGIVAIGLIIYSLNENGSLEMNNGKTIHYRQIDDERPTGDDVLAS